MTAKTRGMFSDVSRKVSVGAAACVITAAAALTPMPVAQADPIAPLPLASAGSVGGSAGGEGALVACDPSVSPDCAAVASITAFPGGGTILQNRLWWFGPPNPAPPTQTPVFVFYPLNLLPAFIRPLFSWFADINYEACILGLTLQIGPYGAVSGSYSRGCAT